MKAKQFLSIEFLFKVKLNSHGMPGMAKKTSDFWGDLVLFQVIGIDGATFSLLVPKQLLGRDLSTLVENNFGRHWKVENFDQKIGIGIH